MQFIIFVFLALFVGFALFWPMLYFGLFILMVGLFIFSPLFRTFVLLMVGLIGIMFVYSNINLF